MDSPAPDLAQRERTLLSWNRFVLAVGATGVLVLRHGSASSGPTPIALMVALTAGSVIGFGTIADRRYRRSVRDPAGNPRELDDLVPQRSSALVYTAAAVTVAIAVAALLIVVSRPG
ncbi:DUF202 domain-containing protein [Nocardiaceae bacterium NPDC056970]|uniref:DUF202 domain-containing protein n=1 Tax=Rhodococcus sp. ACT016 TaxID=3134808 RepID=UPI003626FC87